MNRHEGATWQDDNVSAGVGHEIFPFVHGAHCTDFTEYMVTRKFNMESFVSFVPKEIHRSVPRKAHRREECDIQVFGFPGAMSLTMSLARERLRSFSGRRPYTNSLNRILSTRRYGRILLPFDHSLEVVCTFARW
jgi:hypothetical protein